MQTLQLGGFGGGSVSPCCKLPLFCYISLLDLLMWNTFLLTTHSNFFVLNLKLGVQTNYPLAWMFFLTLATAFPMKTVCSCWIWKLSNDACPLNLIHSASFLTQSNWLEKKSYQLHLVRIEALGTKLIPTKTMVRRYVIGNAQMVSNAFYTPKVGLGYIENSAISL